MIEVPIFSDLLFPSPYSPAAYSPMMPDELRSPFYGVKNYDTGESISKKAGVCSNVLESKSMENVTDTINTPEVFIQSDGVENIQIRSLKKDVDTLRVEMTRNFASVEKSLRAIADGLQTTGFVRNDEDSQNATAVAVNRKRLKERLNAAISHEKSKEEITDANWKEAIFGICAQNYRLGKEGSRSRPTRLAASALVF